MSLPKKVYGEAYPIGELAGLPIYDEVTGIVGLVSTELVGVDGGMKVFSRANLLRALGVDVSAAGVDRGGSIDFPCGLQLWPDTSEVTIGGELLPKPSVLTIKEYEILQAIARSPRGGYVSREGVLDAVWGKPLPINPHLVDVHLTKVRAKLGVSSPSSGRNTKGPNHGLIVTKHGVGLGMGPRAYDPTPLVMPAL